MAKNDTLCWRCAKCCGGCSWTDGTFTPVVNWEAKPDIIKYKYGDIQSYIVKSCPEFEQDTPQIYRISNEKLAKSLGISKDKLVRTYSYRAIEELKKKLIKEKI